MGRDGTGRRWAARHGTGYPLACQSLFPPVQGTSGKGRTLLALPTRGWETSTTDGPAPPMSGNTARGTGSVETAAARSTSVHRPRFPPSHFTAQLVVLGQGLAWTWKGSSSLREPPESSLQTESTAGSRALLARPSINVPATHQRVVWCTEYKSIRIGSIVSQCVTHRRRERARSQQLPSHPNTCG